MVSKLSSLCLIMLFVVPFGFAQRGRSFCSSQRLEMDFPKELPIALSALEYTATADESGAHLQFQNGGNAAISQLFLMIEFFGRDQKRVSTLVFGASMKGGVYPVPVTTNIAIGRALSPGSSMALTGVSQLTSNACPTTARLSRLDITYVSGAPAHYSAPSWEADPSFKHIDPLKIATDTASKPTEFVFDLGIDKSGKVTTVKVRGVAETFASAISGQIAGWSFNPAIKDGARTESQLTLLVRIHTTFDIRDPTTFDEGIFKQGAVMPIDVFISRDAEAIFAGGLPLIAERSKLDAN